MSILLLIVTLIYSVILQDPNERLNNVDATDRAMDELEESAQFFTDDSNSDEEEEFIVIPNEQAKSQGNIPDIFRLPTLHGVDLFEITVDELQHHFSSRTLTSWEYTRLCLSRIQKVRSRLVSYPG
jgi:hypothetical protein